MSNARSKESGMRNLWLGIIGLAAASTANAAVVTFTLSYNDDGFGNPTPNNFAVYADVTQDAGGGAGANGGLFAYGVDLASAANAGILDTANPNFGKANLSYIENLTP